MKGKEKKHKVDLGHHGRTNVKKIFWNLTTPELYEHIIKNEEGHLSHLGPIVVTTGEHTGRAANDKFFVEEPSSQENIAWGKVNKGFTPRKFDALYSRVLAENLRRLLATVLVLLLWFYTQLFALTS